MKTNKFTLSAFWVAVGVSNLLWMRGDSIAAEKLPLDKIQLPPGFEISLYAEVPGARSMTLSPSGTLFIGTQKAGKVYAIQTRGGEQNKKPRVIAQGLNTPNGVAFRDGALYVAEISRVLRYDGIESRLNDVPKPVAVNNSFPSDRQHGWKFIAFGPDERLYIPVGAPCNICEPDADRYALIKPHESRRQRSSKCLPAVFAIRSVLIGIHRPRSFGSPTTDGIGRETTCRRMN